MTPPADPRSSRAYLLGAASEPESEAVEAEYFADESALDAISEVERDLIDDFLDGRLAPDERARFESHYLASPVHQRRVAITRSLRERARAAPARAMPRPRFALALALAAGLVGLIALYALRPEAGGVESLTLRSSSVRSGGELPAVRLDGKATQLELRLERGESTLPPPLRATIATVEGVERWRGPARAPTGAESDALAAVVTLPASSLADGDYVLSLEREAEPDDSPTAERYPFRVVRR